MTNRWGKFALFLLAFAVLTAQASYSSADSPTKKGIGAAIRTNPNWLNEVKLVHAHWFYSWGMEDPTTIPEGVEYVPMVWSYHGKNTSRLVNKLAQQKAMPAVHCLLGYNEPDGKNQANMTVEAALDGWPYLMQTGLLLGSPAAVNPRGAWMQSFMQGVAAKNYRVDFVCIHWYGGDNPQGLFRVLKATYDLYHRPLWITEFAVADWKAGPGHPDKYSPAQVATFMRAVLPVLNKLPYVQRYAWFPSSPTDVHHGSSALFNTDGSLTALGKIYAASP